MPPVPNCKPSSVSWVEFMEIRSPCDVSEANNLREVESFHFYNIYIYINIKYFGNAAQCCALLSILFVEQCFPMECTLFLYILLKENKTSLYVEQ